MNDAPEPVLDGILAGLLTERAAAMPAGHCLRIDDVTPDQAHTLAAQVATDADHVDVHILAADPSTPVEITAERAIELRNRKRRPLLLLVPAGQGHAASSLDNSFERVPTVELLDQAAEQLTTELGATSLSTALRTLRQLVKPRISTQDWAEYLATLSANPTEDTFGRALWQVGLIPDHGPDPEGRLVANSKAAQAITRPSRPVATVTDRLVSGGVRDHDPTPKIRGFLNRQPSLSNNRSWTRQLGQEHPGVLTFDQWPLVESISTELEQVTLVPFTDAHGKADAKSKLKDGPDGQLICVVPVDGSGEIVLRWQTNPTKVDSVAKWIVEIVPPFDLRTDDSAVIGSARIAGSRRQATVKVEISEDDLGAGSRFVARLTAEDSDGQSVQLSNQELVDLDSQEFEVVVQIEAAPAQARKATALSIAEASLSAAVDGLDDRSEDLGTWDLARRVFSVRLGGRRLAQIRVSPLIVGLQRDALTRPTLGSRYRARSSAGTPITAESADRDDLELPKTLGERRAKVFSLIAGTAPRDTAETVEWSDELREAVTSYVGTYRRALDSAEPDQRQTLLSLESLTASVRMAHGDVQGVVVLPLHPLRLAWILRHDEMLRTWASQLEGIARNLRRRSVDTALVSRITPANLPFTILSADGEPAVYFDELTFGSGLYLKPHSTDPEADSAAICSALETGRQGFTQTGAAEQVAERVRAYVAAHPGMPALRTISLNPGAGELVHAGLRQVIDVENIERADPLRLELVIHSDHTSYTRPLADLQQLQTQLRVATRDRPGSHLMPPLSLSVRAVDDLLADDQAAHLAIIQGLASASLTTTDSPPERATSLDALLTPTITSTSGPDDTRRLLTMPALRSRGSQGDGDIAAGHRAHQAAVGAHISPDGGYPAIEIEVDVPSLARLTTLHARADWVLTVDRHLGVGIFEDQLGGAVPDSFILDYAPDFVDGIGDRLTVTTTHRSEVERILDRAMRELGLSSLGRDAGDVLRSLSSVSGRLALRLLSDNTLARESVSLAALMMHLKDKGELEGVIVLPVDTHPEIFGPTARQGEDSPARRCDLLLVRVSQRSFKIECVEVKARKRSHLPQALADDIADQVTDTAYLLMARYFATDPPRDDAPLQRARLSSLLHYYADRSSAHGLIDADKLADTHRHIDRIEDQQETPELSLRGFVMSLEGEAGFPKKVRDVPITVLTARELGRLGFTTMMDIELHNPPEPTTEPATSAPSSASASPAATAETGTHDEHRGDAETTPTRATTQNQAAPAADSDQDAVPTPPASPAPAATTPEPSDDEPTVRQEPEPLEQGRAEASPANRPAAAPETPSRPPEITVVLGTDSNSRSVNWEVSTKGSPHAFILGIPGQGKSVTTRRIITDFAEQGLPALVFDFHGDMAAEPPPGATVVDASQGLPFSPFELNTTRANAARHASWEVAEILQVVCGLGEIQRNNVYQALSNAYADSGAESESGGLPTMGQFTRALEDVEATSRGKNARARLTPLTDFGLFPDETPGVFNPADGGGMIVDLSGLGLEEVQLAAGAFLLRKVYNDMFSWPQRQGMKLAVVLDEAHRMAKDVTLPRLMKEGRKYGISVVVASQGVEDFHSQVLENAGTKIVFRTNFPASRKVAGFLRGRGGQDMSEQIERLGVGQAYVSTPDESQARRVYMRE